jgi:hypothetical protein
MSNRAQMILRNAAFLGPAGSNGLQGVQGPTGATGSTAAGTNAADSPTLTNTTVSTAFANVTQPYGGGTLAVGTIIRSRWSGIFTTGAAQQIALSGFLGTAGMAHPNWTVPTAAATYHFYVELETIVRTIGAGGTVSQTLRVMLNQDLSSNAQTFTVTQNVALDTTAAQTAQLKFAATVGNNTAIVRSFHSDRYN